MKRPKNSAFYYLERRFKVERDNFESKDYLERRIILINHLNKTYSKQELRLFYKDLEKEKKFLHKINQLMYGIILALITFLITFGIQFNIMNANIMISIIELINNGQDYITIQKAFNETMLVLFFAVLIILFVLYLIGFIKICLIERIEKYRSAIEYLIR